MEATSIITALLPPRTAPDSVKRLKELSDEESALRHRLELKVERGLYRAASALQELGQQIAYHSPQYSVEHYWRHDPKVQRFLHEATMALHVLGNRQLYRSTHLNFDDYCRDRFGSTTELYPDESRITHSNDNRWGVGWDSK